jgi:hypothetical protein
VVVTAVDPAGQRWEVTRRWYVLRRAVPYEGPRYDTPSDRRAGRNERPSAWGVVGWNNSRRAVSVVADALAAGEDLSQLTPFALEPRARELPLH